MKKIFLLILTLCTSIGVWADDPDYTKFEHVYLIGNAMPNGWTLPGTAMSKVENEDGVWTWTGTLSEGQVKIHISDDNTQETGWNHDQYYFATNDNDGLHCGVATTINYNLTSDNKFYVGKWQMGENRTIVVDFNKNTIKLESYEFQINNLTDLQTFGSYVNGGENYLNAKLNNDITEDMTWEIGYSNDNGTKNFCGTFDGNGHYISLNINKNEQKKNLGLFGAVDGATIKNVIVKGSVTGDEHIAGLVGLANGPVTLENCGNEAEITAVDNAAGFVGCAMDVVTIKNCYNKGAVKGSGYEQEKYSAAFCAWMQKGGSFENCYNSAIGDNLSGNEWLENREGVDKFKRLYRYNSSNTVNATNCYDRADDQATAVTEEQVVNGYLCYNLNGSFTQDLSNSNSYPTFGQEKVAQMTKISDAQYATWVATANVDKLPYGVTAYSAELKDNNTWVKLNPTKTIKKDDAVVLYKENATDMQYTNVTEDDVEGAKDNKLIACTEDDGKTASESDNFYVLANKNNKVGFYKVKSGVTIPKGKAYLSVTAQSEDAREFLGFGEIVTSIENTNVNANISNTTMFNFAGQRVNTDAKGIVIINGKKIIK